VGEAADSYRYSAGMWESLTLLFCFFKASLSGQCNLALENLALRQQLAILKRTQKRPAISTKDRLFWVWLSRIWSEWRASLLIVKPDTVIGWHRKAFVSFGPGYRGERQVAALQPIPKLEP
jgi:hypothetical protein